MSTSYKYSHLRASPIGKCEQDDLSPPQYAAYQKPPTKFMNSASKTKEEVSPLKYVPQKCLATLSSHKSANCLEQHQIPQYSSLDKQNDFLRDENRDLNSKIERLKAQLDQYSSFDKEELMNQQRENSCLSKKVIELEELVKKYEEKSQQKCENMKLMNEQECKLTTYYSEQLSLKQEEIHKTKNKLQLSEMNTTDIANKLRISEKEHRQTKASWDEDLKQLGSELESLNKQLLKQHNRNEQLELLVKVPFSYYQTLQIKINQQQNQTHQMGTDTCYSCANVNMNINGQQVEFDSLNNSNLKLQNRIQQLENEIELNSNNQMSHNDIQNSIYKDKLEQNMQEHDELKVQFNKKLTELTKAEKDNCGKDFLVQQMVLYIDQLENVQTDCEQNQNSNSLKDEISQLKLQSKIQKQELDLFANELRIITNQKQLLEEQLYQLETLRQVQMQQNPNSIVKIKKDGDDYFQSQPKREHQNLQKMGSFGDISKEQQDLNEEIVKSKTLQQTDQWRVDKVMLAEQLKNTVFFTIEKETDLNLISVRQETADFSPSQSDQHKQSNFEFSQSILNHVQNQDNLPYKQLQVTQGSELTDLLLTDEVKEYYSDQVDDNSILQQDNSQTDIQKQPLLLQSNEESIGIPLNPSDPSSITPKLQDLLDPFSSQKTNDIPNSLEQQSSNTQSDQTNIVESNIPDLSISNSAFETPIHKNRELKQISSLEHQEISEDYTIKSIQIPRIEESLIELDIVQILNYSLNNYDSNNDKVRYQFDKQLEGTQIFDLMVGFVGVQNSGKSTIISSLIEENWDINIKKDPCMQKLQIYQYICSQKRVGLCESDHIQDNSFMHFICNFSQALVLFFNAWEYSDQRIFVEYIKLMQSEKNFASECIVIHSSSELLTVQAIHKITKDLVQLQEGLYRGKVYGKYKMINIYHLMLPIYDDSTKEQSIFNETIAVCRGTIIGKLTSSKERIDVFKKLNKFLMH